MFCSMWLVIAASVVTVLGATGDQVCGAFMCVTATVNGSVVEYELSSTGKMTPGWMGMGFGSAMPNTPMIVMWANSDGTVTLSQRQASSYTMPTVVDNPERVATLQESLSSTSTSDMKLAFSVDATSDTKQNIIYAFGLTNPDSTDAGATLQVHVQTGAATLNLAGTLEATSTVADTQTGTGTATSSTKAATSTKSSSGSSSGPTDDIPLQPYQRMIVAHAVFCSVGFLVLLPFGSLLARYLRTFSTAWYTGHWITQFGLAGTAIVIGIALGVQSVTTGKALHLDDDHKKWGVALFVLYLIQCGVGALIHYVKPKRTTRRPVQNYFHAVFGILVISLSFYQVRTGYKTEWPNTTGRGDAPHSVDAAWTAWVVIVPIAYAAGLALLPKQYRQEAEARKGQQWAQPYTEGADHINMAHVQNDRFQD